MKAIPFIMIGMAVFLINWAAWLCPFLVYEDWQHPSHVEMKDVGALNRTVYVDDKTGGECGDYYQITEDMGDSHVGKWATFSAHDPWKSWRGDAQYVWPILYFSTEKQAKNYLEKFCKQ